MKKYRFLSCLLVVPILLGLLALPTAALEDPELQCRNAILIDANFDEILYAKDAYDKAYPASITKVMTALLVLEAIDAGQLTRSTPITASETALAGMPRYSSTANIKVGEIMSVEELLYCLLLPSANEAGNVLAEAIDKDLATFAERMTRRAAELGCQNTNFVNAHGLHNDQHYTTAYDITLFMQAALEYDLFRQIINTPSHTIPATNLSSERLFYNTNGLISNLYYYGYVYGKCIGGKTGSTDEAGKCLVSVAEDGDRLLISVILGSSVITLPDGNQKQGQLTESIKLFKHGFDNFERVTITQADQPVDKVSVTLSRQADEVMVKPQGSIVRTLPKDLDLNLIETQITLFSPEVAAPVEAGQVLGSMTLSYEGEVYGTLDLVAVTSVERSELLYKKAQFIAFFQNSGIQILLVIVLLLATGVILKLFVFRKRRYSRKKKTVGGGYRGGTRR